MTHVYPHLANRAAAYVALAISFCASVHGTIPPDVQTAGAVCEAGEHGSSSEGSASGRPNSQMQVQHSLQLDPAQRPVVVVQEGLGASASTAAGSSSKDTDEPSPELMAIPYSAFVVPSPSGLMLQQAEPSAPAASLTTIISRKQVFSSIWSSLVPIQFNRSNRTGPGLSNMLVMAAGVLRKEAEQEFDPFVEMWPDTSLLDGPIVNRTEKIYQYWGHDLFPQRRYAHPTDGDEGLNFFKAAPSHDWLVLASTCVALCLADFFVFQRLPFTWRCHLTAIGAWIFAAMLFNMWVWSRMGRHKAVEWCSGYVLEWMLSMDNIFVFHLIFQTYQTPVSQIHKAVFVGVIGAVLMRMVFFMVVSTLLHLFHWMSLPFGALLIWSGIEAARGGDDDTDVEDTALIRGLKHCLGERLNERYEETTAAMFTRNKETGKLQATLLLIVVACLECTDIIFALDSVSAKVAQIPDQYIAFSSSVLAMFGLRAMFFVIQDLVEMFDLMQYGLCIILVFIGTELIFSHYIHLAASTVCIMIVSVLVTSIVGSVAKKHWVGDAGGTDDG